MKIQMVNGVFFSRLTYLGGKKQKMRKHLKLKRVVYHGPTILG